MEFPQANAQSKLASRKILEDLQLKKQLLLKQGVASSLNPPPLPVLGSLNAGTNSENSHSNAINSVQKQALQQAHAQSMGYFITQDSMFGNLIIPVIPRFDVNTNSSTTNTK